MRTRSKNYKKRVGKQGTVGERSWPISTCLCSGNRGYQPVPHVSASGPGCCRRVLSPLRGNWCLLQVVGRGTGAACVPLSLPLLPSLMGCPFSRVPLPAWLSRCSPPPQTPTPTPTLTLSSPLHTTNDLPPPLSPFPPQTPSLSPVPPPSFLLLPKNQPKSAPAALLLKPLPGPLTSTHSILSPGRASPPSSSCCPASRSAWTPALHSSTQASSLACYITSRSARTPAPGVSACWSA